MNLLERLDREPDVDVLDGEYARLLGFPAQRALEGRSLELACQTREWYRAHGRPWIYLRQARDLRLESESFALDGRVFHSAPTQRVLTTAQASHAFIAAVSAGSECEARAAELWREGKPDEYFFMEMYGGAVVEHLIAQAGAQICAWGDPLGLVALPHYSPGYPDWDVAEQVELLKALRSGAQLALPPELDCLESGMLRPKKSLLGVFGVASAAMGKGLAQLVPCESCALPACAYRRLPYATRDVAGFQDDGAAIAEHFPEPHRLSDPLPIDVNVRYATNAKALRKWARERLELSDLDDGGLVARFLYEGTTCSNMGHPIRYVYRIRIASEDTGFRVLEAECEPAPGDEGHKKMCEYLKLKTRFSDMIAGERPLLGEPLDAVRDWDLPGNHSGCYCDAGGRNHKWRIVYEVVHYALAQRYRERQTAESAAPLRRAVGS